MRDAKQRAEARLAWLSSSDAGQERQRSRTAYRGANRQQASQLLADEFSTFIRAAEKASVAPAQIERYTSDYTAIVKPGAGGAPPGKSGLLVSTIPLRTETAGGAKRPVDLALQDEGGSLSPKAPLADFTLPQDLGEGIGLGGGISLSLPSASSSVSPSLVNDTTAIYPNVATDTDLVASPVPSGLQLSDQLRSPQSPEAQEIRLRLPAGAQLQSTQDGGAQVTIGGATALSVSPPVAADAQGRTVPASLTVEGDTIRIQVQHAGGDWAYPILVDPVIDSWSWVSGDGNYAGWGSFNYYAPYTPYSLSWDCMYGQACFGRGINIYAWAGQTYGQNTWGGFQYRSPGWDQGRSTYIQQAVLGWVGYYSGEGVSSPFMYAGLWNFGAGQDNNWSVYSSWWYGTVTLGSYYTDTKELDVQLWDPWVTRTLAAVHHAYVGSVAVYLYDREPPILDPLISSSGPPQWVDSESATIPLRARDPGLGVRSFLAAAPNKDVDGDRLVAKHSGKCLDVPNATTAVVQLQQWDCQNPAPPAALPSNQIFDLVPSSPGYYQIVAENSGECLDVWGASTSPGAGVYQYPCLGPNQANQQWQPVSVGDGYYQLVAKHSGQCLDVTGVSTANGAPLQQYTCLGANQANQLWRLDRVKAGNTWSTLQTAEAPNCTGNTGSMCPADASATLSYDTETMPEGANQIQVKTTDAGGAEAGQQTHVLVDRSPPDPGDIMLKVGSAYADSGGVVVDPSISDNPYALRVEASDGNSSTLATARSGVKYIGIKWDGQLIDWKDDDGSMDQDGDGEPDEPGWGPCINTQNAGFNLGSCSRVLQDRPSGDLYGQHQIEVIVKDELGHVTDRSFTVSIPDRTGPELSVAGPLFDSGDAAVGAQTELTAQAKDSQSGATSVRLLLDGQQIDEQSQPCYGGGCELDASFAPDLSEQTPGSHTITAVAADAAGNTASRSRTFALDPNPPALSVAGPLADADGQPLPTQTAQADITATDGEGGSPNSAAFPTTPILDRFDRDDGALGANWSGPLWSWDDQGVVSSNQYAASSAYGDGYWNARTFTDSEVYATAVNRDQSIMLMARIDNPGTDSMDAYLLRARPWGDAQIIRIDNTDWTTLASTDGEVFGDGDQLGLRVVGDKLTAYVNGEPILSTTDPTYSSGYIGLAFDTAGTSGRIDDFGGGAPAAGSGPGVSGISRLTVELDGELVSTQDPDCSTACPASVASSYTYDKAVIGDGAHDVRITAADQAGNMVSTVIAVNVVETPPDPVCPDAPPATTDPVEPLTPAEAAQQIESVRPSVVAASIPAQLPDTGEELDPSLSPIDPGSSTSNLEITGAVAGGSVSPLADQGFMVSDSVCLRPTEVTTAAELATVVNGDAAVLANTAPQTDTVVRPTAYGATAVQEIRGPNAPNSFSWRVGLADGQELRELPNGAVAIVEPDVPVNEGPADDLPPQPPNAQTLGGIPDVATQIADGEHQVAKAEEVTGVAVVAVIAPPWVRDAAGQPVPATLTVNINQITLTITPWSAPEPLEPIEWPMMGVLPLLARPLDSIDAAGRYSWSGDSCQTKISDPTGLLFVGSRASVENIRKAQITRVPDVALFSGTGSFSGGPQGMKVGWHSGGFRCRVRDQELRSPPFGANALDVYHQRLWLSWKPNGMPKTATTPHWERLKLGGLCHAVIANVDGPGGDSGFDIARHKVRLGFEAQHRVEQIKIGNDARMQQCDGKYAHSDGWLARIWVNSGF